MVERLSGEDSAWLHMDDATNPMVVSGMMELTARLTLERAYSVLEPLAALPRFRARISERSVRMGPPTWEPAPDFDLREHVEHVDLAVGGDAALQAFIGRAVSTVLDPKRPLWHVFLVDRPGTGTTVLYRVHHAIGDGFALLDVLLSLCDDEGKPTPAAKSPSPSQPRPGLLASASALRRLVTLPADPDTVLKRELQVEKHVAWSAPISLARIKEMAHAMSATVNDVLVAVITGALKRYLGRPAGETDGIELHAMVPVNLRPHEGPVTPGNRFGLVILGLPIGVHDPIARVGAVKQRMKLLKATPEAVVARSLLSAMGWAPRPVEDRAAKFFAKKASLVLTNVPGPRTRLHLDGIPIQRIIFWVPEAARIGLGISIFSYAGEVTVGVFADAMVVPDPTVLIAEVEAELAALEGALAAEQRSPCVEGPMGCNPPQGR